MPRGTGKRTSAAGAAASDTLPLCDETTCALCKLTHELRSRRDRWLRINVESYHYDVPRTSSAMLRVLIVTLETDGSRRDCLAISRDGVPCMLFREIKTRMTSHGRIKKEDQRRSQFNKMYSFCSSQPPFRLIAALYCFASVCWLGTNGLPSPGLMRTSAKICFGRSSTGVTLVG